MTAASGLLGAVVVLDTPTQTNGYWAYPVNVSMGASENVAGLQFDIQLDSSAVQVVDVEMGPAAIAGGKDVVFSMLDSDTVRVLVVGLNGERLSSGVVANLYVTSLQPSSTAADLYLGGLVVSDPLGNPVAPQAQSETEDTSDGQYDSLTPATTQDTSSDGNSERALDSAAKSASDNSGGGLMGNILNSLLGDDYVPANSAAAASDSSQSAGGSAELGAGAYVPDNGDPAAGAYSQYLPPQTYIPGAAPRAGAARTPATVPGRTAVAARTGPGVSSAATQGGGVMPPGSAAATVPAATASLARAAFGNAAAAQAGEHNTVYSDYYPNGWAIVAATAVCLLTVALWISRAPLIGLANRVLRPSSPERD